MKPKSWDVPGKGGGITSRLDENLTKLVLALKEEEAAVKRRQQKTKHDYKVGPNNTFFISPLLSEKWTQLG